MNTSQATIKDSIGTLLISSFFVFVAVMTLYDTTTYSDIDSKVFPRSSAIGLLVLSLLTIIWTLVKPVSDEGFGQGSWWRRIVLVLTMLIACVLMPQISFLPAGALAFAGGLVAAMHDQWSRKTLLVYWVVGAAIISAFYMIFINVLHVPLP
ncbi:MAG: tripartite tricarboxylate transporter TctB family protein [Arenicella sp.]